MDFLREFIILLAIIISSSGVRLTPQRAPEVDIYKRPVVPVLPETQYTSFKDQMVDVMKVDSKFMDLPEVKEWYNKKYVITGKRVDLNDTAERGQIITVLSSMFCTNCWNQRDCACLKRLGCFQQC